MFATSSNTAIIEQIGHNLVTDLAFGRPRGPVDQCITGGERGQSAAILNGLRGDRLAVPERALKLSPGAVRLHWRAQSSAKTARYRACRTKQRAQNREKEEENARFCWGTGRKKLLVYMNRWGAGLLP